MQGDSNASCRDIGATLHRVSVSMPAAGEQSSGSPPQFIPFAHTPWGKYRDVIAYSGFSDTHVENAAYAGLLKSSGEGTRRRFHRDDVDAWMRRGSPAKLTETAGVA
jgi:hypothetical protein